MMKQEQIEKERKEWNDMAWKRWGPVYFLPNGSIRIDAEHTLKEWKEIIAEIEKMAKRWGTRT